MNLIKLFFGIVGILGYSFCIENSPYRRHRFPLTKKLEVSPLQGKYETQEEKENLFKALGLVYMNQTLYSRVSLEQIARTTLEYRLHTEYHNGVSNVYKSCITQKTLAPMTIAWIESIAGYGVFAQKKILKDSFIGVYGGIVIDSGRMESHDAANSAYAVGDFPVDYRDPNKDGPYFNPIIDAADSGNELRFINDNGPNNANCLSSYVIGEDDFWHACFCAARDIEEGEQLFVDYGKEYWEVAGRKFGKRFVPLTDLSSDSNKCCLS